ncbi:OprO/OprP family phosphate-selective porin [Thermodesulfobacteriota bacterium]
MVKKALYAGLWLLILTGPTASHASDSEGFRVFWKNGFRIESSDKEFRLRIGGRIMNDWAFFLRQDDEVKATVGDLEDGTEFRRARFYMSGTIYGRVIFESEIDFTESEQGGVETKDLYIGLKKLPIIGTLKVGHFKEPFSLEALMCSKYITFMERSLADVFAPGRNVGIMTGGPIFAKRMTWHIGFFRETDNAGFGKGDQGGYAGTFRLTGLPYKKEDNLLHLGFAYRYSSPDDDVVDFDARPESHLAENFVNTGDIPADRLSSIGAETALVAGPFSVQGEYMHAFIIAPSDFTYKSIYGYYIYVSWFLTGENRPYKSSSGKFGRVRPRKNFLGNTKGAGAWEVAVRYSHLDLDDEEGRLHGGILNDFSTGINWYLNAHTRVMLNYVFADLEDVGNTSIFQMRFQVDF